MRVRRGVVEDFAGLWALRLMARDDEIPGYQTTPSETLIMLAETYNWFVEDMVYLVLDGDSYVGYLILRPGALLGTPGTPSFRVDGFFTLKSYRPKAGHLLALKIVYFLKTNAPCRLQSVVLTANTHMRTMLEAHRFRSVGTVYELEMDDEQRILDPEASQEGNSKGYGVSRGPGRRFQSSASGADRSDH